MGAIISSAACCAGEAACCVGCMCCSKILSSLCSCGSSKTSPSSGRKRSVGLLLFSIIISLILQYFVAPNAYTDHLEYAWHCDSVDANYQEACRGNSAVLRVSFCSAVFFLLAAVVAAGSPASNKAGWFYKIILYLLMVGGSMFLPSNVFDEHGYLQIARIGGAVFVVLQQIILIDIAYNWNDAWVTNGEDEARAEGLPVDTLNAWQKALLWVSAIIFVGSYTALGFLFHYFGGCSTNSAFLCMTLILTLGATVLQCSGEEGTLLTSAVMTGYAVFLAYSAVSNNPDSECNPMLGSDNGLDLIFGIALILASMTWTCFSYASSMTDLMTNDANQVSLIEEGEGSPAKKEPVTGVVTGDGNKYGATDEERKSDTGGKAFNSVRDSVSGEFDGGQAWKLNVVLVLLSMWYPMVLTSWGSINEGGQSANKGVGEVAMWMIVAAQWVALALYIWTIVAPRLFPDRDFT